MCYSAVVQALARAGEVEEARKLFEEAASSGKDLSSGCIAVLVGACQRAGDFEGAARWQKDQRRRAAACSSATGAPRGAPGSKAAAGGPEQPRRPHKLKGLVEVVICIGH
ncbi:unnamed protein product [Prorocentrum cordatum]|uniref:Uncharacterized protein n=1 Tax=Prorocentrum cordatum TaxID=2364126 RepID=A0ABN9RSP9_9DINO|nr:unnamed protein product [Polarella glacialis]